MRSVRLWLAVTAAVATSGLVAGCANVRGYQREHLADPIMVFDGYEASRELHWVEAREGATGGTGGAGGGCACN
jgi:hypothetical protein